ncbi:hypothetical protein Ae263Ps1_6194 [Pseudonocardia sp. Ae263_Ps1]|nr:hypothetical protein Ae263Ps1_6194 [Pseudonocardia sp. Ae263_Ps1]
MKAPGRVNAQVSDMKIPASIAGQDRQRGGRLITDPGGFCWSGHLSIACRPFLAGHARRTATPRPGAFYRKYLQVRALGAGSAGRRATPETGGATPHDDHGLGSFLLVSLLLDVWSR